MYSSDILCAVQYFIIWICHNWFNCSPTDEHLGFQFLLQIMQKWKSLYLWIFVLIFLDRVNRRGGCWKERMHSYLSKMLTDIAQFSSTKATAIYMATQQCMRYQFTQYPHQYFINLKTFLPPTCANNGISFLFCISWLQERVRIFFYQIFMYKLSIKLFFSVSCVMPILCCTWYLGSWSFLQF